MRWFNNTVARHMPLHHAHCLRRTYRTLSRTALFATRGRSSPLVDLPGQLDGWTGGWIGQVGQLVGWDSWVGLTLLLVWWVPTPSLCPSPATPSPTPSSKRLAFASPTTFPLPPATMPATCHHPRLQQQHVTLCGCVWRMCCATTAAANNGSL